MKHHTYEVGVDWTGNDGRGTQTYLGYRRDHTIASEGKPRIPGSSDPAFRGDPARYNPGELSSPPIARSVNFPVEVAPEIVDEAVLG